MRTWFLLAPCLLLLTGSVNAAQLYRWLDSDGNVQYTDLPPPSGATDIEQKRISTDIADDDGMSYAVREAVKNFPVTLFVTDCGNLCAKARALLTTRGVPFTEKNPEQHQADSVALKELIGSLEVPVLKVGNTVLKGYLEENWNDALDTAGYPKTSQLRPPHGGSSTSAASKGEMSIDPQVVAKNFPVTLYSYDCGELCNKAKTLLAGRRVPFSEENAQDPATQEKLQSLIGPDLVIPVITVGPDVMRGYDEALWNKALDTAGYPKLNPQPEPTTSASENK
ncbi:MAG TPA: glutaredoxin family protein [Burkholderiales bacterium]|nr:glutaredoxin family protein [Burkholderiales bacterium]